jgi:hypothetical protein
MVVYACPRCLCEFQKKSHYDCHVNRKHKCELDASHKNELNTNTLNLILEELKNVKEDNKKIKEDNKQIKEQMQIMEIKYNAITEQASLQHVNNGSITKINNKGTINNTTINVVAFGKENMDFSIDEIGKLCQGNKTVPNLINYMHFNESKPENHNVYMPNRKNKSEVFVHNGVKWMLADKKTTVEQLIDKGIEYVEGKMEELSTVISKSKYNAVERAIDAYNENEGDANNEANKKITKDIELILYNNKDLIMAPKVK